MRTVTALTRQQREKEKKKQEQRGAMERQREENKRGNEGNNENSSKIRSSACPVRPTTGRGSKKRKSTDSPVGSASKSRPADVTGSVGGGVGSNRGSTFVSLDASATTPGGH